jgi:macrolide-specific efflux system membrane fusion protein
VLFDVDNKDEALKPQMSAQAYFVLARADNALTVPMAALQLASGGSKRSATGKSDVLPSLPEARAEPRRRAGEGRPERANGASRQRAYVVRVLNQQGKIEERQVTVGVTNRIQAQILSGLAVGETVVIGIAEGNDKGATRPAAKGSPSTRARL